MPLHASVLFVLLLSYLFYPDTTYHSVYHRACLWHIQCLKDREFQQRKWNLLNLLSNFISDILWNTGHHFLRISEAFHAVWQWCRVQFVHPSITKHFKDARVSLPLTWKIFLCPKIWFTFLVIEKSDRHLCLMLSFYKEKKKTYNLSVLQDVFSAYHELRFHSIWSNYLNLLNLF